MYNSTSLKFPISFLSESFLRKFGLQQCRQNLVSREQLIHWLECQQGEIGHVTKVRHRDPSALLLIPFFRSDIARQLFAKAMGHSRAKHVNKGNATTSPVSWHENSHYQRIRFLGALIGRLRDGLSSMDELQRFLIIYSAGSNRIAIDSAEDWSALAEYAFEAAHLMKQLEAMEFIKRFKEALFLETMDEKTTAALYRTYFRCLLSFE